MPDDLGRMGYKAARDVWDDCAEALTCSKCGCETDEDEAHFDVYGGAKGDYEVVCPDCWEGLEPLQDEQ
jgi:hypothetical protein